MITGTIYYFGPDGRRLADMDSDTPRPGRPSIAGGSLWVATSQSRVQPEIRFSRGLSDRQMDAILAAARRLHPDAVLV